MDRGEWFCAEGAAGELRRAGDFRRALSVMEPFVETGWRPALYAKAEILLRAGRRSQEVLDLVRPEDSGRASTTESRHLAEVLGKAGRVDEAIELLVPHLDKSWLLSVLVDITDGQGRDERVLELIAPLADRARQACGDEHRNYAFSDAQELQARVLERAGRADEAIRILGQDIARHRFLAQNTLIAYAELLARHGRLDELRALVGCQDTHSVLDVYAGALRRHGRVEEAEAVMRDAIAADDWVGYRAWLSSMLLAEGRLDDAIVVENPHGNDIETGTVKLPGGQLRPPSANRLDHLSVSQSICFVPGGVTAYHYPGGPCAGSKGNYRVQRGEPAGRAPLQSHLCRLKSSVKSAPLRSRTDRPGC